MENPAPTDVELNDLIRRRWSPRRFSDRPVEDETLVRLLEAARWAPSSFNDQPWHFIVARKQNEASYEAMLECLVEANQKWARTAPVLMITVARLNFEHNGKPNRHAQHDLGLAVGNLSIQAMHEGLFVHQMAGYDADRVRQQYRIPEDHEPVVALALGYTPRYGETNGNGEDPGERTRKPLREFVFAGGWNRPSPLVSRRRDARREGGSRKLEASP